MFSQRQRSPNDKTAEGKPRYTDDEIAASKKEIIRLLKHFDKPAIEGLMRAIREGTMNQSFTESDLLATLAKAEGTTRNNVFARLQEAEYRPEVYGTLYDPAEQWCKEIGPPFQLCIFSQLTYSWCENLLQEMSPPVGTTRNSYHVFPNKSRPRKTYRPSHS